MGFDLRELVITAHVLAIFFSVTFIFLADKQGFAWIFGKKETLDAKVVRRYHHLVSVGLATLVLTGAYLFWPMREFLLTYPKFLVKMGFVGLLIGNAFVIGKLMSVATTRPYNSLSAKEKVPLFISGAVSTIARLGAISIGIYLFD